MIKETPRNIEELKKKANNKNSWRERLSAVNVLKEYDCKQSKDILARLVINDPVFKVKETAFRAAQALGVTSHGNPIYLGKGKKGNLVKGINKKLEKVRNSLPDDYSFEDFKSEFQKNIQAHMMFMRVLKKILMVGLKNQKQIYPIENKESKTD